MAESKGRGATAVATPVDSQAALKRLDALEKEVRSLKMTLAFMNRSIPFLSRQCENVDQFNHVGVSHYIFPSTEFCFGLPPFFLVRSFWTFDAVVHFPSL